MILKVNHILQMPGQTFREYRNSSLLLYPAYSHLVRRPAPVPLSRPEHHATPEHRKGCPPALSCRLPNSRQAPRQSLRTTLAFAATTAAEPRRRQPQCSACFTPLRLRARSLRSAPNSPDPMSNQQPRFTTSA